MKKILSLMTFHDKILISMIITTSLFFIFLPFITFGHNEEQNPENQLFVINSAEETRKIPVSETFTPEPILISVSGPTGETFIEMHRGKIRVKEEPEEHIYRIAERQGWIDKNSLNNTIINLPNKIYITLENQSQDDREVDTVTY